MSRVGLIEAAVIPAAGRVTTGTLPTMFQGMRA